MSGEQILAGAGGLVALFAGARAAISLARVVHAIDRVVERELEHNGGGSIKDDVHGIAVAIGHLQRRVDHLETTLDRHLNDRK